MVELLNWTNNHGQNMLNVSKCLRATRSPTKSMCFCFFLLLPRRLTASSPLQKSWDGKTSLCFSKWSIFLVTCWFFGSDNWNFFLKRKNIWKYLPLSPVTHPHGVKPLDPLHALFIANFFEDVSWFDGILPGALAGFFHGKGGGSGFFINYTGWKKITPQSFSRGRWKWWLEDDFPIGKVAFQGLCSTLGGYDLLDFCLGMQHKIQTDMSKNAGRC